MGPDRARTWVGLAPRRVLIDCRRFSGTRWGVAKLVRRLTLDQVILGSNPSAPAIVLSQDIVDACLKRLWTGHRPLRGW